MVKVTTLRIMLALVAKKDFEVVQMDVKTTFFAWRSIWKNQMVMRFVKI